MALQIINVLAAACRTSWQAAAFVSLMAGVTSHHLIFLPFEVDGYAWHLLFLYVGSVAVLIITHVQIGGCDIIPTLCRTLLVSNAYNIGVAVSILTYRAFFHPLNRFPGPFMAKLSRFYAMRSAAKSVKAFEDTQKLHEKFGDIVGVGEYRQAFLHQSAQLAPCPDLSAIISGPRELSINRASAISVIYETPTRTTRSPWYAQVSNDVTKISLNSTRVLKVHKLRKKVWERGLGFRGMGSIINYHGHFSRAHSPAKHWPSTHRALRRK
jgi:hypothetical protein